jgi:asparaginyl-tRNA synthetase
MTAITIKKVYKEAKKYENQEIRIAGWIRTIRTSKSFGFIEVNDGSFFKNIQSSF